MGATLGALDFTALGRHEEWEDSSTELKRHDEYGSTGRATIPHHRIGGSCTP